LGNDDLEPGTKNGIPFNSSESSYVFVLIAGRTSRQGTSLNEGKFTSVYLEETGNVQMNPDDMARLGLKNGDRVCLRSRHGQIEIPCQAAKAGDLPAGLLFLAYGDCSSKLMGGETHGTGMPDSKGFDVILEKVRGEGQVVSGKS
jgi:formylmethanofuran dehydrogenase subunit D